jgi:hypothetical protein
MPLDYDEPTRPVFRRIFEFSEDLIRLVAILNQPKQVFNRVVEPLFFLLRNKYALRWLD